MAPPDKDVKIPCPTPQHLQAELDALSSTLALGEKEDTWEKLERGLIRFASVTKGGGYKHVGLYVEGIGRKGAGPEICACMMSDRGRLSGVATELLQTLAPRLANNFAPLVTVYLDPVVRLLGRPNKVVLKRSEKCLSTIISHCHLPSIILELKKGLNDDAATCRRGCAKGVERAILEWDKEVWNEKGVRALEEGIKRMARDKDPEVRQTGKRVWALYGTAWPERVEEFAAPLSPVTRRYLDIASSNAPTKPQVPTRAMGPPAAPHRPISAASSASSSSAQPPPRATHVRMDSNTLKTVRGVEDESGPSTRRPAPTTSAPTSRAPSPIKPENIRPILSKSTTARPDLPHMGLPSRSVSHNVLPSSSYAGPSSPGKAEHDPWARLQRPQLSSSYSTVSLPVDPSEHTLGQPVRRFPPPSRVIRPLPTPSEDRGREHLFTPAKPVTLGSAVRLANPNPQPEKLGLGRLGPAQRRVVTAPVLSTTIAPPAAATLNAAARGTRSVKKRVQELEEEIKTISNPSSPVPSKSHFQHLSPTVNSSTHSPVNPAKIQLPPSPSVSKQHANIISNVPVDSPLLPVLMRSTNSVMEPREKEEDLRDVEAYMANMTVMDATVIQVAPLVLETDPIGEEVEEDIVAHDQWPESSVGVNKEEDSGEKSATIVEHVKESVLDGAEEHNTGMPTIPLPAQLAGDRVDRKSPEIQDSHTLVLDGAILNDGPEVAERMPAREENDTSEKDDAPIPKEAAHIPLPHSPIRTTADLPVSEMEPALPAVIPPAPFPPEQPRIAKKLESQATGSTVRSQVNTTSTRGTARANQPRKPPVPSARTARIPSGGIDRRPFKPTTHGSAPKTGLSSSTSKKADIAPVLNAAKVSASTTATTSVAAVPIKAKSTMSIPPKPPVPRVVSAKIATQPEITKVVARPTVSAFKTTQPPASKTTVTKPVVTSHAAVTLPPIRKEKVRLKAPLPKFVPVRAKDRNATAGSATVNAHSTVPKATTGKAKVTAKVKPESIPLPMSPAEKAKLPPRDIPLPRSPPASPTRSSPSRLNSSSGSIAAASPLLTNPRVLSPVLTTALPPSSPSPHARAFGTKLVDIASPSEIPSPYLRPTVSPPTEERSISRATRYSSTRTTEAISSDDSDSEPDDMNALDGVTTTIGSSSPIKRRLIAKVQPHMIHQADQELMEFSASSRPAHGERKDVSTPNKAAEMLLAKIAGMNGTPKASPGVWERKALSVRDANRSSGDLGDELEYE